MDPAEQVDRILRGVRGLPARDGRIFIAIGGPPASGKSTLAERAQTALQSGGIPCGLVPMDGFHLDNATLEARGLLSRKGAPETFDLDGFAAVLADLSTQASVSIPHFDRTRDCVVPGAAIIGPAERHVVVEGNYLFLDAPGWRDLARYWTFGVFVAPAMDVLRTRLIARWLDHGLSADAAERRAMDNDLPNAARVISGYRDRAADLILD